jgi:hypothetical protein
MFKKLLAFATLMTLSVPAISHATPTSNYYSWQIWAYVETYREKNTGDVVVTFEDGNGTQITNFPNSAGTNQCAGDPGVVVSKDHPLFDRLSKALLSGGLGRKKIKIAYEGVDGTCYAKMVTVEM